MGLVIRFHDTVGDASHLLFQRRAAVARGQAVQGAFKLAGVVGGNVDVMVLVAQDVLVERIPEPGCFGGCSAGALPARQCHGGDEADPNLRNVAGACLLGIFDAGLELHARGGRMPLVATEPGTVPFKLPLDLLHGRAADLVVFLRRADLGRQARSGRQA